MAKSPRRVHDAHFKSKVVLEALKGAKTLAQLSSEFGIHAQQITERTGAPVEASGTRRDAHHLRLRYFQASAYHRATRTAGWPVP